MLSDPMLWPQDFLTFMLLLTRKYIYICCANVRICQTRISTRQPKLIQTVWFFRNSLSGYVMGRSSWGRLPRGPLSGPVSRLTGSWSESQKSQLSHFTTTLRTQSWAVISGHRLPRRHISRRTANLNSYFWWLKRDLCFYNTGWIDRMRGPFKRRGCLLEFGMQLWPQESCPVTAQLLDKVPTKWVIWPYVK